MLPHQKDAIENPKKEEPFTTMDQEMAKMFSATHPHYDEADWYGNEATPEPDVEDGDDKESA